MRGKHFNVNRLVVEGLGSFILLLQVCVTPDWVCVCVCVVHTSYLSQLHFTTLYT